MASGWGTDKGNEWERSGRSNIGWREVGERNSPKIVGTFGDSHEDFATKTNLPTTATFFKVTTVVSKSHAS
jgi:hypothetical protein